MWIFTRYGFFSVVCPKIVHGLINSQPLEVVYRDRLMIRSRRKKHLRALQLRFPELSSLDIERSDERDYRYRIIVAKELWLSLIAELAREETWTNFKNEVHDFQGMNGADYTKVLHQVWSAMKKFQESAPVDDGESGAEEIGEEPTACWDGITHADNVNGDSARQELADCGRDYNWSGVLEILANRPELVNATRPGGHSLYAPLHQAAHAGAEIEVIDQLISLGAWRTLRNAKGERPLDVAQTKGHAHLLGVLAPVYKRRVEERTLVRIQSRFHDLIREVAVRYPVPTENLRLPELEPVLEFDRRHFWFSVPGMYGGFHYWLVCDGPGARLAVQSWSRVAEGSGLQHDITEHQTTLIDREFV